MLPADHQAAVQRALALGRSGDPSVLPELIAIRALAKYDSTAKACVTDLRDLVRNPAHRDYVRAAAATAANAIEQTAAFPRVYCDRCFDEAFLERRNFETQVQLSKTVLARDGAIVQSDGERRIAEWLTAHGIAYRYDAQFRIIGEFQTRPDLYLPEMDVCTEYWGLDTPQYKMSTYKKQVPYQQEGKWLVPMYPEDSSPSDTLPTAKLRMLGCQPADGDDGGCPQRRR